jgi:hypothetical protein
MLHAFEAVHGSLARTLSGITRDECIPRDNIAYRQLIEHLAGICEGVALGIQVDQGIGNAGVFAERLYDNSGMQSVALLQVFFLGTGFQEG